jgi:hypothetical protein
LLLRQADEMASLLQSERQVDWEKKMHQTSDSSCDGPGGQNLKDDLDYKDFVAQHEDGPCDLTEMDQMRSPIPEMARRESQPCE